MRVRARKRKTFQLTKLFLFQEYTITEIENNITSNYMDFFLLKQLSINETSFTSLPIFFSS